MDPVPTKPSKSADGAKPAAGKDAGKGGAGAPAAGGKGEAPADSRSIFAKSGRFTGQDRRGIGGQ